MNWPEKRWSLWICKLYSNTLCYLLTTPFFSFYKEIQHSISFDIFTIFLLEKVQNLHLVFKRRLFRPRSYLKQPKHTFRKAEPLVNIFQAHSSYAPFGTHQNPSKSITRLPISPCIYKNNPQKVSVCRRIPFLLVCPSKIYCLPRQGSLVLVTWPNIKIAVIKWISESQIRYKNWGWPQRN